MYNAGTEICAYYGTIHIRSKFDRMKRTKRCRYNRLYELNYGGGYEHEYLINGDVRCIATYVNDNFNPDQSKFKEPNACLCKHPTWSNKELDEYINNTGSFPPSGICLFALQDIYENDEILLDYGTTRPRMVLEYQLYGAGDGFGEDEITKHKKRINKQSNTVAGQLSCGMSLEYTNRVRKAAIQGKCNGKRKNKSHSLYQRDSEITQQRKKRKILPVECNGEPSLSTASQLNCINRHDPKESSSVSILRPIVPNIIAPSSSVSDRLLQPESEPSFSSVISACNCPTAVHICSALQYEYPNIPVSSISFVMNITIDVENGNEICIAIVIRLDVEEDETNTKEIAVPPLEQSTIDRHSSISLLSLMDPNDSRTWWNLPWEDGGRAQWNMAYHSLRSSKVVIIRSSEVPHLRGTNASDSIPVDEISSLSTLSTAVDQKGTDNNVDMDIDLCARRANTTHEEKRAIHYSDGKHLHERCTNTNDEWGQIKHKSKIRPPPMNEIDLNNSSTWWNLPWEQGGRTQWNMVHYRFKVIPHRQAQKKKRKDILLSNGLSMNGIAPAESQSTPSSNSLLSRTPSLCGVLASSSSTSYIMPDINCDLSTRYDRPRNRGGHFRKRFIPKRSSVHVLSQLTHEE